MAMRAMAGRGRLPGSGARPRLYAAALPGVDVRGAGRTAAGPRASRWRGGGRPHRHRQPRAGAAGPTARADVPARSLPLPAHASYDVAGLPASSALAMTTYEAAQQALTYTLEQLGTNLLHT